MTIKNSLPLVLLLMAATPVLANEYAEYTDGAASDPGAVLNLNEAASKIDEMARLDFLNNSNSEPEPVPSGNPTTTLERDEDTGVTRFIQDRDGDGHPDTITTSEDLDGDGIDDRHVNDDNADGMPDSIETYENDPMQTTDADGDGNYEVKTEVSRHKIDKDADGDVDEETVNTETSYDDDGDGTYDRRVVETSHWEDNNGDGIIDDDEKSVITEVITMKDTDGDGVYDTEHSATDYDGDGKPEIEIDTPLN